MNLFDIKNKYEILKEKQSKLQNEALEVFNLEMQKLADSGFELSFEWKHTGFYPDLRSYCLPYNEDVFYQACELYDLVNSIVDDEVNVTFKPNE